jgi:putative N6-adenine-specific DNA methylase
MRRMEQMFVTCARGLEPYLAHELRQLGAQQVEPGRGGVGCRGDRLLVYRANLWLRTAVRVLVPILQAPVHSPEELYEAVQTIDWTELLTPEQTLAVDCNVRDSAITHSHYAALKTKDAICDQFVARLGRRPSVDTERPSLGLNLHIHRNVAILSLDSSWDSLHKRGYRPHLNRAPLNEALAAGLVLHSGWQPELPLVDPMCGSGTLLIEAAWLATNRAPGLTRKHFGFMGWRDFDIAQFTAIRDEARRAMRPVANLRLVGSDRRRDAIDFASKNARAAGVGHLLRLQQREVRDFQPPAGPPGLILCNPPYGERIGERAEVVELYRTFGEVLRRRCRGWRALVFVSADGPIQALGLPVKQQSPFFNGSIPCRLVELDLS